jgi:hypothetical protein
MVCFGGCLIDDFFDSSSVDIAEDDFGAFRVEEFNGGRSNAVDAACEDDHFIS